MLSPSRKRLIFGVVCPLANCELWPYAASPPPRILTTKRLFLLHACLVQSLLISHQALPWFSNPRPTMTTVMCVIFFGSCWYSRIIMTAAITSRISLQGHTRTSNPAINYNASRGIGMEERNQGDGIEIVVDPKTVHNLQATST